MKKLSGLLFISLLLAFSGLFADQASDVDTIFNWAEDSYPQYFPTGNTSIATNTQFYNERN